MRTFQAVLEQEKREQENRYFRHRQMRSIRYVFLTASLLLFTAWLTSRWMLASAGVLLPALLLYLRRTWERKFSLPETARIVDQHQGLNELVTTAEEFRSREQESSILSSLMDEADRRLNQWQAPSPTTRERNEQIFLFVIFLLLLLLNLLRPFLETPGVDLRGLKDSLSGLHGDQKKEIEKGINDLQKAETEEERSQAAEKLGQAIQAGNADEDLRALGESLAKNGVTKKLGESLAKGDPTEGARQAGQLAKSLGGQTLSGEQAAALRKTLDEAQSQLSHGSTQGLASSLQEMRDNADNPQRLQQAAQQMARDLESLAKNQAALQKMGQKLGQMKPGAGQPGQQGPPGPQGQGGQQGQGSQQGQGNQKGQAGQKGPGKGGPGQNPGSKGAGGKSGQKGPGDQPGGDKQGQGQQAGNQSGASPWKLPPGMQQKDGQNGMGVGGKQAGGKVTQDPKELVKNGKSRPPQQGKKILDFKQPSESATSPQFFADFEKAELLTDQDRQRLQARQENLARSREIDEFCQRHRAAPRMRTFLRDFFALPARP